MDENGNVIKALPWWAIPALVVGTVAGAALLEKLHLAPYTLEMAAALAGGAAIGYVVRCILK